MNSNTFADEHGTWVASGSSKYSDVFDFFHAFDRSTSDFWETNASPSYLQIEIPDPESYYIDGYLMRISKFNNRYSKDWTLQGSDDGKTWDDLDKQTGQNLSDMEEHKYPLTLRKAYKYYRLNMSNYASSMCSLPALQPKRRVPAILQRSAVVCAGGLLVGVLAGYPVRLCAGALPPYDMR